ncbi:MAG: caspase family protein, partial [Leptolyngbya sp.]|nr:caspase family protein [Candidatus Melainabacteria bacterium]
MTSLAQVIFNCVSAFGETRGGGRENSWEPAKTLVFVVGVLKWRDKSYLQFTTKARRDEQLVDLFRSKGVSPDRIVYLQDQEATLANFQDSFQSLLAKSNPDDTLIFYYCGHGWLDSSGHGFFANYDVGGEGTSISTAKIASTIKRNFRGKQALFFADCCSSGSIGDALASAGVTIPYAMASSVVAHNKSTSNWTFSQSIVDAFAGHKFVDSNKDGVVSFEDLSIYSAREMKQIDNQLACAVSENGFLGDFVLSKVTFPDEVIPLVVEVRWRGKWWKAKLLEITPQKGKIRWCQIGYDSNVDEDWYPLAEIRTIDGSQLSDFGKSPGTASSAHAVGSSLSVLWKGKY